MRFAVVLALAAALAVAATAYGHGAAPGVPRGFHPETAGAVGTRDVWILGWYRCKAGKPGCSALVRSTDGGRHFTRVAMPPLSNLNTPTLEFTSARVGYAAEAGSRLFVTHDGGSSWAPRSPAGLSEFAVGGGDVYAVFSPNRFERSPVSEHSWHTVTLPVKFRFLVSLAAQGRHVWLLGSTRHIRAGDMIVRSTDRGTTLEKGLGPCVPELGGRLVPAGGEVVWALPDRDDGGTLPVHERRAHVPVAPLLPRSRRFAPAGVDERRRDLSELEARRHPVRRCAGPARPHNGSGKALGRRTPVGSRRPGFLAPLCDQPGRRGPVLDPFAPQSGAVLADDRRRLDLAFHGDSLTAFRPALRALDNEAPR